VTERSSGKSGQKKGSPLPKDWRALRTQTRVTKGGRVVEGVYEVIHTRFTKKIEDMKGKPGFRGKKTGDAAPNEIIRLKGK